MNKKSVFFISPIGDEGSVSRKRSDSLLKHIIDPIVKELKLEVMRGDQIERPGMVVGQIFEYILGADLVIADLTDNNPNVFYELAARHASKKPTIHLFCGDGTLPFDLKDLRFIQIDDPSNIETVNEAKDHLKIQIKEVTSEPSISNTPLTNFEGILGPRTANDVIREIYEKLSTLTHTISKIDTNSSNAFDELEKMMNGDSSVDERQLLEKLSRLSNETIRRWASLVDDQRKRHAIMLLDKDITTSEKRDINSKFGNLIPVLKMLIEVAEKNGIAKNDFDMHRHYAALAYLYKDKKKRAWKQALTNIKKACDIFKNSNKNKVLPVKYEVNKLLCLINIKDDKQALELFDKLWINIHARSEIMRFKSIIAPGLREWLINNRKKQVEDFLKLEENSKDDQYDEWRK